MNIAARSRSTPSRASARANHLSPNRTISAKCQAQSRSRSRSRKSARDAGVLISRTKRDIRNYRTRVRQCEAIGEYALAEQIRKFYPVAGITNRSCNGSLYEVTERERPQKIAGDSPLEAWSD